MSDEWLTTRRAAELMGVSRDTIARWIRLGQLPAMRLPSGQYRVRRAEIERLMAEGRLD